MKWKAITIVGRQLLSLVVFTTLARLLEPAAFGLVGLVGVYLTFVSIIAEQGIGEALIQRRMLEPEHLDTAFWLNVGCSLILCLGTIAVSGRISIFLGEQRLAPLLRWLSVVLVINATSAIHGTLFVKEMDFRRPAMRILIANGAGGVVGVVMALCGSGVWALVGQQLSVALAGGVFFWTASPYRPRFRFSWTHLRDLLGVSSAVFATSLLWFFSSRLDQIVIGRFAGVAALGLYVIASKVPDLAKTVTQQPMAEVSLAALSRLQHDNHRMQRAIYNGMELNAILSFAVFVGIAAVASDLVPVIFGKKWAAAEVLCALLSLYGLVNAIGIFIHPVLVASGGAGKYLFLNIWHVLGVLGACVIGIHYGVNYLVLGMIVNGMIVILPALFFIRRRVGLSPLQYCKPCLVPALASLFMVIIIRLTAFALPRESSAPLRLTSKTLVGGIAYIGFVSLFGRASMKKLVDTIGHSLRRSRIVPSTSPVVQV